MHWYMLDWQKLMHHISYILLFYNFMVKAKIITFKKEEEKKKNDQLLEGNTLRTWPVNNQMWHVKVRCFKDQGDMKNGRRRWGERVEKHITYDLNRKLLFPISNFANLSIIKLPNPHITLFLEGHDNCGLPHKPRSSKTQVRHFHL